MDRHGAYKLLSDILSKYQALRFSELEDLAGHRRSERVLAESGEELILDVQVAWLGDGFSKLLISATADSPSTFRMERLEERVVVSRRPE